MHKENFLRSCYKKFHQSTFLGLFALSLVSSCNLQKDPGTIIINPLNAIEGEVFLSDFTDDISYIPLDNEIMFQHPNRIETTEELFIMATYPGNIMVYDRQGKYRNMIGSRGRGPGEYYAGFMFTIDQDNELVYILDRNKIIVYTFQGLLEKEFSIEEFDSFFTDIHYQDGKLYLACTRDMGFATYDWLIIDTSGNLLYSKENNVPGFLTGFGARGAFFLSDSRLQYWNTYNDTVFAIQEEAHQPFMYFAQGDFREPKEDYPIEDFMKYFRIYEIIGTKNIIFLRYHYDNLMHEAYINNENGRFSLFGKSEVTPFNYPGINNNLDGGPNLSPSYIYNDSQDEYLIGWIYSYKLKAHVKSDTFKNSTPKHPEKKKQLEALASSLDENDNPVLMLVKLKP